MPIKIKDIQPGKLLSADFKLISTVILIDETGPEAEFTIKTSFQSLNDILNFDCDCNVPIVITAKETIKDVRRADEAASLILSRVLKKKSVNQNEITNFKRKFSMFSKFKEHFEGAVIFTYKILLESAIDFNFIEVTSTKFDLSISGVDIKRMNKPRE